MGPVSISELKAHLSEYIRYVTAGERIVVTDRGEPVAVLGPVETSADDRRARLIRSGQIRPAKRPLPPDFLERELPADPEGTVRAALIEERRTGR